MRNIHYHACPECYEKYACDQKCTIEPDLEDPVAFPGIQFGAHCVCFTCESKNPTPEWFAKYNGFIR